MFQKAWSGLGRMLSKKKKGRRLDPTQPMSRELEACFLNAVYSKTDTKTEFDEEVAAVGAAELRNGQQLFYFTSTGLSLAGCSTLDGYSDWNSPEVTVGIFTQEVCSGHLIAHRPPLAVNPPARNPLQPTFTPATGGGEAGAGQEDPALRLNGV